MWIWGCRRCCWEGKLYVNYVSPQKMVRFESTGFKTCFKNELFGSICSALPTRWWKQHLPFQLSWWPHIQLDQIRIFPKLCWLTSAQSSALFVIHLPGAFSAALIPYKIDGNSACYLNASSLFSGSRRQQVTGNGSHSNFTCRALLRFLKY